MENLMNDGVMGGGVVGGVGNLLPPVSGETGVPNTKGRIQTETIAFGVRRTSEGYRAQVHFVQDGIIVDTKEGADQLKHHALAMLESHISGYVIDSYDDPMKFFTTVTVR